MRITIKMIKFKQLRKEINKASSKIFKIYSRSLKKHSIVANNKN